MATFYVYSGGNNTTGSNFTNAYTTLQNCLGNGTIAAGDTIYIANDHNEALAGSTQTYTFPGTSINPNIVLCVTRADPPTALNTMTNSIGTSGAFGVNVAGSFYMYGVTLVTGSGTASIALTRLGSAAASAAQTYEACAIKMLTTHTSATIGFGATGNSIQVVIRLINTKLTFSAPGQKMVMLGADFYWTDTATAIQGTAPTTTLFVDSSVRNGICSFDGVDLSALAAATKITPTYSMNVLTIMANCKMASGVDTAEELFTAPVLAAQMNYAINCSDGVGPYKTMASLMQGRQNTVTATYRDNGASDGTTHYAWKIDATANCVRQTPYRAVEIARYNTATGAAMTATVEIATDNVTLTDNECWIEVRYPDSSSVGSVGLVTSACQYLATPANLSTSAETWTGVPGTPVKQYIRSPSFTPQAAGDVRVILCYAKTSGTVYVDPMVTVA